MKITLWRWWLGGGLYLLIGISMVTLMETAIQCPGRNMAGGMRSEIIVALVWPAFVVTALAFDWPRCPKP